MKVMHVEDDMLEYVKGKSRLCEENDNIAEDLFIRTGVNRGLRDVQGKGVLTGLTNISRIDSTKKVDGKWVPCDGELRYRGYLIQDLIKEFVSGGFGFEKTSYLLLFGEKPSDEEAKQFIEMLNRNRKLPTNFTRDVIMKAPTSDVMNSMTKSILTLSSYDGKVLDADFEDNILQSIKLISIFPMLAVYSYLAYDYSENRGSMYIHQPDPEKSTAENILMMLRLDKKYSPIEAQVLDAALMLHAEHGGGNNSSFTTRVVTSSGADIYSAIAAAMCSLKGPRHGGANIKVMGMMDDIKANVRDWEDDNEIYDYLLKMLEGQAYDGKGLIYGMGHAVYSISDPRERVFKDYVVKLANYEGRNEEMGLYQKIEDIAPKVIADKRRIYKGVSPNVDFYSGFVYEMLGIPREMFTPLFAIARISGWCAHRLEEMVSNGKIIRPAYLNVDEAVEKFDLK